MAIPLRIRLLNRHSPNGRWFQLSMRHFGVPGKLEAPPTSSRRGVGTCRKRGARPIREFCCHQDARLPWFLMERATTKGLTQSPIDASDSRVGGYLRRTRRLKLSRHPANAGLTTIALHNSCRLCENSDAQADESNFVNQLFHFAA
jgi:hypothetical protein